MFQYGSKKVMCFLRLVGCSLVLLTRIQLVNMTTLEQTKFNANLVFERRFFITSLSHSNNPALSYVMQTPWSKRKAHSSGIPFAGNTECGGANEVRHYISSA